MNDENAVHAGTCLVSPHQNKWYLKQQLS